MKLLLRICGIAALTLSSLQFAGAGTALAADLRVGCANNKCDGAYSCEFAGFNSCCMGEGHCTTYDCMTTPETCPD